MIINKTVENKAHEGSRDVYSCHLVGNKYLICMCCSILVMIDP